MTGWLPRFGLHAAAALGATGIFVAAAAVGAHQTHPLQPGAAASTTASVVARPARTPGPDATAQAGAGRGGAAVRPERSLSGTIEQVLPNAVVVRGLGGRQWQVQPVPGALLRLNGKAAALDSFQPGDRVIILGQTQGPPGNGFLAHAITARRTANTTR